MVDVEERGLCTFEQQLGKDMMVGVDLIDRKFRDIMAMINVNDDYTERLVPGNPLTGGTLSIFPPGSDQAAQEISAEHEATHRVKFTWTTKNAAHLGFEHPVTGKRRAFESPLPADMARHVAALEAR